MEPMFVRIAHGQPGGVGIAAVSDNLYLYRFGGLHFAGEVAGDDQGDHGRAPVQLLLQVQRNCRNSL